MGLDFLKKVLPMFKNDDRMKQRGFFTQFAKVDPEDYTKAEFIEFDTVDADDYVAPTLRDLRSGAVAIDRDVFVENKIRPPVIALENTLIADELLQRQAGESDDAASIGTWFARAARIIVQVFGKFHRMVKDNVELQVAEVLQTGKITLKDDNGNEAYKLDLGIPASHFPTTAVSWDASDATPLEDIAAMCGVVNEDGRVSPDIMIVGRKAWAALLKDPAFEKAVKRDGLNLGALNPGMKQAGGRYVGYIDVEDFHLDIWLYTATYKNLGDDTRTAYMNENKVLILPSKEFLELHIVFGGVPTLGMDEPFRSIVPQTVRYDGFLEIHNRMYRDQKKDGITAESKSRPLVVPKARKRFGCLTAVHN